MATKSCTKCGEVKPFDSFTPLPSGKNGLHPRCKKCLAALAREYRKLRPDVSRKSKNTYWLKRAYGISQADFDAMFAEQDGLCAICKSDVPGGNGRFAIDHCHKSGVVRGLLCTRCNTGLGLFRESPDLLARAINYVSEHSK